MSLYPISRYYSATLFGEEYPDLINLNKDFYSRFEHNEVELKNYNKEWTLFDVLFLLGITDQRYQYECYNIKAIVKFDTIISGTRLTIIRKKDILDNIYAQLVTLNRAPNSYPFNFSDHSRYLIVTSLGGDIDNNTIPDNRRGAFYMLTPENYNTDEIYERMNIELNNGILYPESTDVLFRYRSRIVLDLASESKFSFGGNINIYEINNINNLPKNKINTNLFYLAFLIGKYFDTDRFFRQFPIDNKLIPYDPENVYTWVPQNIAMMIAHRRDIRSNLRLSVHELLKLEDEKDPSYINRIKSGQINNEHMEEILLYFALLGNDVEALSFLNMMDVQKILELYVKIPQLELHRNRINTSETVTYKNDKDNNQISANYYNSLIKNIRPILNVQERDKFAFKIVGYSILVDYETYKEMLITDYSILRSLYILKGCPEKRALLTSRIDTLIGLLTGQFYSIANYSDKSYLTNYIDLISKRLEESPITNTVFPGYETYLDDRTYYIYSVIADHSSDMIKGLIEVNTNNVDSLARLNGISLEFLNYSNINPNDLPDQKVRNFRNTIVTMASYFNRQSDRPELSLSNVKNIDPYEYNDFELLALFNLHPIYDRSDLKRMYRIINGESLGTIEIIPLIPLLLRNEEPDTVHFLNTNNLTINEEPMANFNNTIVDMLNDETNHIRYTFDNYLERYIELRNKVFPNNMME